ncbi:hypothetical protein HGT73_00850 [Rosenbergiella australiborealis]|uniref:Phosphodiesterase n=1 Tax=Rosenbergiella australiborealis TaxID=1544696 RepID=A0ABS5T0R8_9GAMM|nr:hypothetical protein [Rosenbergiella australiborealis]MBT0725945.1 hypothetical protein [Rosenbergiella australiborealis]
MIVISHRGYWKSLQEKNTEAAFIRSFQLDLGTETDLRDFNGEIVISHDIPDASCISFHHMLELYKTHTSNNPPLALNVKADGLQDEVKSILEKMNITNYFFFDMALPDSLTYNKRNLNAFVRYSEYESLNALYDVSKGVWLDGFEKDLVEEDLLQKIISDGKKVCIVSPELHKRNHIVSWEKYRKFDDKLLSSSDLIICTDYPEECMEFFNGY